MPMPISTRPATTTTSHTSTQQWQSFEIKMRYRRADRCVRRAEAALEAGIEEDARAALDEARSLNPDTPTLESLRAAVRERQALAAAAARRVKAQRVAAAVTASLLVALGAGALWLAASDPLPLSEQTAQLAGPLPTKTEGTAPPADPKPGPPVEASANPTVAAAASEVPTTGVEPPAPASSSVLVDRPKVELEPLPNREVTKPPQVEPTPEPVRPAEPPPVESGRVQPSTRTEVALPGSILPVVGVDRLVSSLPAGTKPVLEAPPPPPAPEPRGATAPPEAATGAASPPPDPAVVEEPKVRAVLARFESAYSNLDASAAQTVWPGVDGRSLARAFDSLESQRVSLGRCSIALTGTTAQASCSGNTTWTPKIGGGTRSEARRWEFDLSAHNGSWYIVSAQAR
jgi:hypothetical protein